MLEQMNSSPKVKWEYKQIGVCPGFPSSHRQQIQFSLEHGISPEKCETQSYQFVTFDYELRQNMRVLSMWCAYQPHGKFLIKSPRKNMLPQFLRDIPGYTIVIATLGISAGVQRRIFGLGKECISTPVRDTPTLEQIYMLTANVVFDKMIHG